MENEMEIVYVDPGYGKLVAYPTPSVYTGRLTWVKNKAYNPTSDVAFTHDSDDNYATTFPTYALLPDVLDFDQPNNRTAVAGKYVKKVCSLKCLAYFASGTKTLEIGFNQSYGNPIVAGVSFSTLNNGNISCKLTAFTKTETISGSANNYLCDISITYSYAYDARSTTKYIRSGSVTVSGFSKSVTATDENETSTLPTYQAPKCCVLYRGIGTPHPYVSNVLVGQGYYEADGNDIPEGKGIPVDTRIYRLTTSATNNSGFSTRTIETEVASVFGGQTMKESNTEYYTNTNGAKLLQQISSSGDTPANHIVVYGNPGYREGANVTEATGMEGTAAKGTRTLSAEQDAHICDWWKDGNATTFSSLYGKYVGWKAGG